MIDEYRGLKDGATVEFFFLSGVSDRISVIAGLEAVGQNTQNINSVRSRMAV